jgi:hypothetical protein
MLHGRHDRKIDQWFLTHWAQLMRSERGRQSHCLRSIAGTTSGRLNRPP